MCERSGESPKFRTPFLPRGFFPSNLNARSQERAKNIKNAVIGFANPTKFTAPVKRQFSSLVDYDSKNALESEVREKKTFLFYLRRFVRLSLALMSLILVHIFYFHWGPWPALFSLYMFLRVGYLGVMNDFSRCFFSVIRQEKKSLAIALKAADLSPQPDTRISSKCDNGGGWWDMNAGIDGCFSGRIYYASSCMQGWRRTMEDAHIAVVNSDTTMVDLSGSTVSTAQSSEREFDTQREKSNHGEENLSQKRIVGFFGVFDGHNGRRMADAASQQLYTAVKRTKHARRGDFRAALKEAYYCFDKESYAINPGEKSGCTATTLLLVRRSREEGDVLEELFCANAGDSRCVMCRNGQAVALSEDHKPKNILESVRIRRAGFLVYNRRINGALAVSRSLGDFAFKKVRGLPWKEQAVSCDPDVRFTTLNRETDEFCVLACDGIWDVMNNNEVISFIRERLAERLPLETICERLMMTCLNDKPFSLGCDNMTVIIVLFEGNKLVDDYLFYVTAPAGSVVSTRRENGTESGESNFSTVKMMLNKNYQKNYTVEIKENQDNITTRLLNTEIVDKSN